MGKLCVDLIGPYHIKNKANNQTLRLWCVTMIHPTTVHTGWFKMKELKDKEAITVVNVVKQNWLTCYPWHNELILDRGTNGRICQNDG